MTNKELLEILSNIKSSRALELAKKPSVIKHYPLPVIDWEKRQVEKNAVFTKYLKIMTFCFVGLLIICSPIIIAYPDVGRSILMGMPPMAFVAISWMMGAWYAWDKEQYTFMALTVGVMPIRIGVGLAWVSLVNYLPNINMFAFILGMMLFWLIFTIPEFSMFIEFSKKFPRDGRQNEV